MPRGDKSKYTGKQERKADHIAESGMAAPAEQLWFPKAVTAVNDPYGTIDLPRVSSQLDYEAELVMVIGRGGRHIGRDRAKDAIFGFCAGNDVSVRDWQRRTSQFTLGKSFDSHAPFGPWIATADGFDPHAAGIRCLVNGELRQDSDTRHMIFDCFDQVALLSQAMTLEPGDVFFTGTPGGVAMAMDPPAWLKAGDSTRRRRGRCRQDQPGPEGSADSGGARRAAVGPVVGVGAVVGADGRRLGPHAVRDDAS